MRLTSIKLSGFKSFAEPTTFQLPGQRVGVVGPNGCGKSNIIDAVRWVLGESKASELRGESMQDVIFNGSTSRKPASRASVELVFDNTLARAGGQWNTYAEIAVRRVLTRDGTSSYYINGQPVRRRDVQDVFLGTGLGPRAYAIIGQGTISRIIESRPEELRLFLEEAAGVSKYKERRRETENRLKDTRENLVRVDDILRELNANLEKLEKQAEVAAQYRALQEQGTLKLHQLWFLKHRDAASEEERVKVSMAEAANALESRLAELRAVEAELESVRQAHYAANDELHARQGALGVAALEVSRLEERIRYVVEGRQRAEARLAELTAQNAQWADRQAAAGAELEEIGVQIEAGDEQAGVLAAQAEEQALQLPGFEEAVREAQAAASRQRSLVAQVQQQIQVLAAESRSVDEQSRQLKGRRERLELRRVQDRDGAARDAHEGDGGPGQVGDARQADLPRGGEGGRGPIGLVTEGADDDLLAHAACRGFACRQPQVEQPGRVARRWHVAARVVPRRDQVRIGSAEAAPTAEQDVIGVPLDPVGAAGGARQRVPHDGFRRPDHELRSLRSRAGRRAVRGRRRPSGRRGCARGGVPRRSCRAPRPATPRWVPASTGRPRGHAVATRRSTRHGRRSRLSGGRKGCGP